MRTRTTSAVFIALCTLSACGGAKTGPSGTQSTPVTQSFSGTTRQTINGCAGDSHDFTASAGDISVKLVETSDPAAALSVQICAGGIDTGSCTIRQQKILVGQTLTGARVGIASQTLKLLGHNCVFGGPPATDPITYRADVTYQR